MQSSTKKEVKNNLQRSRQRPWPSGSGQTRGVQEGEVNVAAHIGLKSPRQEDTDMFEYSRLSYSNEAAVQSSITLTQPVKLTGYSEMNCTTVILQSSGCTQTELCHDKR